MIQIRDTRLLFALIVGGTILGLAGTDLVLPAIPSLPGSISGTLGQAQLVLAAFTGGTALGLLVFGELGARFDQKLLLAGTLAGYSGLSLLCSSSDTILELVLYRAVQGFFAAAPAVFAPGMIRVLFDERSALRAMGLMGSIESVVPALAPVAGAWLLGYFDWTASFIITAVLTLALAGIWLFAPAISISKGKPGTSQGYPVLLMSGTFMRYALSQAFTLGGLLIFVFGTPTVMVISMKGSLADFVTMQVIGIALFIVAANIAHSVVERFGAERTIFYGSALAAAGSIAIFGYALFASDPKAEVLWFLFAFVNLGLGFRGPPGFYQAILASGENDARGAALVILLVFAITAGGTAALAPFITLGLVPLAATAAIVSLGSVVVLALLPALPKTNPR